MKKVKVPDSLILISFIIVLFIVLTYVVPSGEYERVFNEKLGRELIVPDSYHEVEKKSVSFLSFFTTPIKGIVSAGEIVVFVILIGASLGVINKTKSIEAGIQKLVHIASNNQKYKSGIIALLMFFCSLGGATFGMEEEVIALLLIFISLSKKLGYDSIVGVAIPYVGSVVGFSTGFLNPFSVQIAQSISEIPLLSGSVYRIIIWITFTAFSIFYVIRYAKIIEKKPKKSLMYGRETIVHMEDEKNHIKFNFKRKLVLIIFGLGIVMLILGSKLWDWYIEEFSGVFLALSVVSSVVYRLKLSDFLEGFKQGASELLYAGIIIGMAKGILVVAEEGKIIDTILHHTSALLSGTSEYISVQLLLVFQAFVNLFIPSGSGQAALVMPIIAPLSDMIGITRQTAVLAFQFGDGFANLIVPTSGVTMGILSMAKIPYEVWFRWAGKMLLWFIPICIIFLIIAVYIGYDKTFI